MVLALLNPFINLPDDALGLPQGKLKMTLGPVSKQMGQPTSLRGWERQGMDTQGKAKQGNHFL
jgi:hypothetical protein